MSDAASPFLWQGDTAFALLMEAVPGCAALVDGQGRLVACNPAWLAYPGDNPFLAGLGIGADYLGHCQGLAKAPDGNHSLVAVGILSALKGNLGRLSLDYPVTRDGATSWFAMTATALKGSGPQGAVIAHADITEKMLREKRLKRNEQLFKATTENALDLIALLHTDGKAAYVSPSYAKVIGYLPQALAEWNLLDTVAEADREAFKANCLLGLRSGLSPLFEYDVVHRDGGVYRLEARAVAVENPGGEKESVLLVSRDISAKKEAEQEKARLEVELRHSQKLEAIGQLAAGIAHEINTPCQYLSDNMGFLEDSFRSFQSVVDALKVLVAGQAASGAEDPGLQALDRQMEKEDLDYLSEEVPRAIAQSKEGLARISTIVRAMKVFGHPGTEALVSVNLNEALENAAVVSQSEWKYVAEVETRLDPALPMVLCSPGEMNQVFLNLIVNAAHAIGETLVQDGAAGLGRITLHTRKLDSGVEIRIQDSGPGIPEAIRDQVFLPFFTTKPVGKGTGQGLSIVHAVIKKHGGSVDFESEPGQGTCFRIVLPLSRPGGLS